MKCPRCGYEYAKRSLEQNNKMWAMLTEISQQKQHCGEWRTPEDWKKLFMDDLAITEQKVVPSLDGQRTVVLSGQKTRDLPKAEMAKLITCMQAYGDQHEVKFATDKDLVW